MVELLKQPQYVPMSAIDQVIQIFAGGKGALDSLTIEQVQPFATALVDHFNGPAKALRDELAEKKTLKKDGLADRIEEEIKNFKSGWSE